MKKTTLYYLTIIYMILIGCDQIETIQYNLNEEIDEYIKIAFNVSYQSYTIYDTRLSQNNEMYILVFDENRSFISRHKAELKNYNDTGVGFIVSLPKSSDERTLHFIAGYDWTEFDDASMTLKNDASVVGLMHSNNTVYWSKQHLENGINSESLLSDPIILLRNKSKISVTNEDENFEFLGYTIHNIPSTGTIAPFNTQTYNFEEHTITEPLELHLQEANIQDIGYDQKELFERDNQNSDQKTNIIIKGNYKGDRYYYKIDLVDLDNFPLDIERNFHYNINIKSVNRVGYDSFEDAVNGPPLNSSFIDPYIYKGPIISDDISRLELSENEIIVTKPNQEVSIKVTYWPDASSSFIDNSDIELSIVNNDDVIDTNSIDFNVLEGKITFKSTTSICSSIPKEALLIVSKGSLSRIVRVIKALPYEFKDVTINSDKKAVIENKQNALACLQFTIPNDFPNDLFPIPIKMFTEGLYPNESQLDFFTENGESGYIYWAFNTGTHLVDFKTNTSFNVETVYLKNKYFENSEVVYVQRFAGILSYGDYNTIMTGTEDVIVNVGELELYPDGRYKYIPDTNDCDPNTEVDFLYIKKENNKGYTKEYSLTTSIDYLSKNTEVLHLPFTHHCFEGMADMNGLDFSIRDKIIVEPEGYAHYEVIQYTYGVNYRLEILPYVDPNEEITISVEKKRLGVSFKYSTKVTINKLIDKPNIYFTM